MANGNEQLLISTEHHSTPNGKYPVILSLKEVFIRGKRKGKYRVKDWFRKYVSPEESFTDHARFFFKYRRYHNALVHRTDPEKFAHGIWEAGYAMDPEYVKKLVSIIRLIEDD